MRYPLRHKTRQSVIVAALLLAVGALATAAAHVSRSGTARGDIALLDPIPDRAPASLATPDVRTVAPLFAAGSTAAQTARITGEGAAGALGQGLTGTRRFDLVPENRSGGSSGFRDFAGERTRTRNARSASGGSGAFGGGGGGFGGGGWGGVSGTDREEGRASVAQAPRPARTTTRSGSSGGGGGATVATAGAGPAVVTLPAAASPVAVAAVGQQGVASPLGSSPGTSPTPEPLTLLLVGSGLAGLYGARKHLAG